jgi:hypothetical protein
MSDYVTVQLFACAPSWLLAGSLENCKDRQRFLVFEFEDGEFSFVVLRYYTSYVIKHTIYS